ncbi:MAG: TldD/PmbA family protein [Cyanobacterium sp. T60_A2020_053]|nr:TldD/PmbA family protein [Cyanobacterium sp. T60_A2020_053]
MDAKNLLHLAQKRHFDAVEVYEIHSHSQPICFEANRLKQIEVSEVRGRALRIWYNGCAGVAVAYGDFNPDDLIDKALSIAQLNEPETVHLNSNNRLIYQEKFTPSSLEQLINEGRRALDLIKQSFPDAISSLDIEIETETTTIVNSQGLYCQYTDHNISSSLGVELVKDEDFLGIYDGTYSRDTLSLDNVINNIFTRLKWAKNNSRVKTKQMPILFTNNAVTILWEIISEALNGKKIIDKSSPWCESMGKQVISPLISISQQTDFQPYNCPFDDEGTPCQNYDLIKQGKIANFYGDLKSARQLGINPTGNGFRPSLGAYPAPDLVNLVVAKGADNFQKMVESIEYGLIIDQVLGNEADISGDFSLNVDLGYLVRHGEIIGRVKDTMVTGNIYQALQSITNVGNDNTWNGSCYTPAVIVDSLSVVSD